MLKPIPSPFADDLSGNDSFDKEIEAVIKKYGYQYFILMFSNPVDSESDRWRTVSSEISNGMLEYVRDIIVPFLEEDLS